MKDARRKILGSQFYTGCWGTGDEQIWSEYVGHFQSETINLI